MGDETREAFTRFSWWVTLLFIIWGILYMFGRAMQYAQPNIP